MTLVLYLGITKYYITIISCVIHRKVDSLNLGMIQGGDTWWIYKTEKKPFKCLSTFDIKQGL